jgi:ubiquinone/menaquinone biosynthesis C-methylase UbiE
MKMRKIYKFIFGDTELHSRIRWREFKKHIEFKNSKILEAGCGNGFMTSRIAKELTDGSQVIGIDLCSDSIEHANELKERHALSNAYFSRQDLLRLEFANDTFDQVLCLDVIEHIVDDVAALKEAARVLKNDGIMVISVPTPQYNTFFGKDFADKIGHLRTGYTHKDFNALFGRAGLKMVDFKYDTLLSSACCCYVYYRLLSEYPRICSLLSPVLYLLSFLDVLFSPAGIACGLVVRAKKDKVFV